MLGLDVFFLRLVWGLIEFALGEIALKSPDLYRSVVYPPGLKEGVGLREVEGRDEERDEEREEG